MEVYLTGGTGFVGQNLTAFLEDNGLTTHKIDRKMLNEIDPKYFAKSSAIIHLAGKAHDLKKTSKPDEYYEVNYKLTKKLYDAFLESEASLFVFMSSVKASSDTVEGVLREEIRPNPQTDYGKSKLMAEEYIISKSVQIAKTYYILRPCMIHGPGNKGNLNLLYNFVCKGIPYPLAAFDNRRSFLSIQNLCVVIKHLLSGSAPSGIYQVADDRSLSTNELITILAQSMNIQPRLWPISTTIVKSLAKLGDFLKLPLNTERLEKLTGNYIVSNEKIKRSLNLELPLTSAEGLKITFRSFTKD